MAYSADWDKSQDWFWEGNVQERIREYMKDVEKFEIMRESDTLNKSHGPDILGKRSGISRHVSVKGYPSDKYTQDFPGGKKGQRKRTRPAIQARHWFSEALFELILAKSADQKLEIALGLPKYRPYVAFIHRIEWLRQRIGLYFYVVNKDKVELLSPESKVPADL